MTVVGRRPDSRLRGNDGRAAGMTVVGRRPDSRLRGNDGRAADFPFILRVAGFPPVLQQVQDERNEYPHNETSIAPFPPLCYNKSAGK